MPERQVRWRKRQTVATANGAPERLHIRVGMMMTPPTDQPPSAQTCRGSGEDFDGWAEADLFNDDAEAGDA